jgi:hypothetical protein
MVMLVYQRIVIVTMWNSIYSNYVIFVVYL